MKNSYAIFTILLIIPLV